jgi:predicted site-specific integrase-resolvase
MNTNTAKQQQQTAVIYARVSSEEQVQGYSIQAQLRACHEWAEKHGYMVGKEYLEEGQSAFRNLEKRTALKELLADSASKERSFSLIIVHKLDRLFRNTLESSTRSGDPQTRKSAAHLGNRTDGRLRCTRRFLCGPFVGRHGGVLFT